MPPHGADLVIYAVCQRLHPAMGVWIKMSKALAVSVCLMIATVLTVAGAVSDKRTRHHNNTPIRRVFSCVKKPILKRDRKKEEKQKKGILPVRKRKELIL